MTRVRRVLGVLAIGAALSGLFAPSASADVQIQNRQKCDNHVCLILFGSGYKVNQATIAGQYGIQGPADYQFGYYAETSPTKTKTELCGGSGDGHNCVHRFDINATYARGVKVCGWIKRVDNQAMMGNPCITF
jgi:hypothetical protein